MRTRGASESIARQDDCLGSLTFDKEAELVRQGSYVKQRNLNSPNKCFYRLLKVKILRGGTLSKDIADSTVKTDVMTDKQHPLKQA